MIYAPINGEHPKTPQNPHVVQFSIYPSVIELDNGMVEGFFKENENFPDAYEMIEWEDKQPMLNEQSDIYDDIREVYEYCSHEPLKKGEVYESRYRKESYEE